MQPLPSISEEPVVVTTGGGATAALLSTTFTTGLTAFLFLGWS
jgi:hypothetical protein